MAFIVINVMLVMNLIMYYRLMTDQFQKAVLLRHIIFVSTSTLFICFFPGFIVLYIFKYLGVAFGLPEDYNSFVSQFMNRYLVVCIQDVAVFVASLSGFVLSLMRLAELKPSLNGSKYKRIGTIEKGNIYIRLTKDLLTDVHPTQCLLFTISSVHLIFKSKSNNKASGGNRWSFKPKDVEKLSSVDYNMLEASKV